MFHFKFICCQLFDLSKSHTREYSLILCVARFKVSPSQYRLVSPISNQAEYSTIKDTRVKNRRPYAPRQLDTLVLWYYILRVLKKSSFSTDCCSGKQVNFKLELNSVGSHSRLVFATVYTSLVHSSFIHC